MNEIRIQKGDIHDMRQEYERQLAAKDARIAALEAALESCIEGFENVLKLDDLVSIHAYSQIMVHDLEALDTTHTAKSE